MSSALTNIYRIFQQWVFSHCKLLSVFLFAVSVYNFDPSRQYVGTMTLEIDFLQKKSVDSNPYDSDKMAIEFIQFFTAQSFSVGQQVSYQSNNEINVIPTLNEVKLSLCCLPDSLFSATVISFLYCS